MKKRIIVDSIIVIALSTLLHGFYEWFPNVLSSIFFPVNESIWEHGKLILTSFCLLFPIDRLIFKSNDNSISSNCLTAIICILLTYLVFTPIYLYILKTKDNMVLTISIYVVCIILSMIIREKFIKNKLEHEHYMGIILFVTLYIIFGILTYNPIKKPIFYDYKNEVYGIDIRS